MTGPPKTPRSKTFMRMIINKRLFILYAFIMLVFVLLIGRLFFLQVVKGSEYEAIAESNSYRVVNLPARRGDIVDMNNQVLASSEPEMAVKVYLEEINFPENEGAEDKKKKDRQQLAENLADLFNIYEVYVADQEAKSAQSSSLDAAIAKANDMTLAEYRGEVGTDEEDEDKEDSLEGLSLEDMASSDDLYDMLISTARSYEGVTVRSYTYEVGVMVAQIVAENKEKYPGVTVVEVPKRTYPNGFYVGHLLGTVGPISAEAYDALSEQYGYKKTDIIGNTGLESQYERYSENGTEMGLRGVDGKRVVEVDAHNSILSTISEEAPQPGNKLKTTIDLNVQQAMEQSLIGVVDSLNAAGIEKCTGGAAVLLDVKTGAVRGMASYPSLDPNDFAKGFKADGMPKGLTHEEYAYYGSETKPQLNRAISAVYPSGSTFKLVTATGLLKAGISTEDRIYCAPSEWANKAETGIAACWSTHGSVNFWEAMAGSCNIYFQKMAERMGKEQLIDAGQLYGFGQLTNIDLPGEKAGLLPTPAWKAENKTGYESEWRPFDTYYTAIGQGATQDTVMQLASYTATIANDGVHMKPYIVSQILDSDNNDMVLKQFSPEEVGNTGLTEEETAILVNSMKGVVNAEGGTASNLFKNLAYEYMPAGKTGTAETGLSEDRQNNDNHGVFIAFAPADDPQVAFACLVEYGKHGSTSAGLVAARTFEAYFGAQVESGTNVSEDE